MRHSWDFFIILVATFLLFLEKQEEFEKASSSLKSAKQERKQLEGKLTNMEDVLSDLKQEKETVQKV